MKLLNSFGPNPRAVRMFALEKGLDLPTEDLDLLAGENRAEPYVKKNPGGQMPALELDDGTIIAETVVICEEESMTGRTILPYIMDPDDVIDIDGPRDLRIAEALWGATE